MRRHELTDEQFALIEPYLPKGGPAGGHPWAEHRRILNGDDVRKRVAAQHAHAPDRLRRARSVLFWRFLMRRASSADDAQTVGPLKPLAAWPA